MSSTTRATRLGTFDEVTSRGRGDRFSEKQKAQALGPVSCELAAIVDRPGIILRIKRAVEPFELANTADDQAQLKSLAKAGLSPPEREQRLIELRQTIYRRQHCEWRKARDETWHWLRLLKAYERERLFFSKLALPIRRALTLKLEQSVLAAGRSILFSLSKAEQMWARRNRKENRAYAKRNGRRSGRGGRVPLVGAYDGRLAHLTEAALVFGDDALTPNLDREADEVERTLRALSRADMTTEEREIEALEHFVKGEFAKYQAAKKRADAAA